MHRMTTTHAQRRPATFGQLLRRWRLRQRLSQADFGQLLIPAAHPSTVSCWEKDLRIPTRKFLAQILHLTDIPAHLALGPGDGRKP